MSLLTHDIGESEGEDSPSCVKRTRRVFPRPTNKGLYACAEILWCVELVRARSRATAVQYFARNLFKKQSVNSGFTIRVVDSILPVEFCDPNTHLTIGFGYAILCDDLTRIIKSA